jgi:hypothetical protein
MTFSEQPDQGLTNKVFLPGDADTNRVLDRSADLGIFIDEVLSGLGGDDSLSLLTGLLGQLVEIGLNDSPK